MRPLSYGPTIVQEDVKYIFRVLNGLGKDAGRSVPRDAARVHRILGRIEGDCKRTVKAKTVLGGALRRALTLLLSDGRSKKESAELEKVLRLVAKMLINDERSAEPIKKTA